MGRATSLVACLMVLALFMANAAGPASVPGARATPIRAREPASGPGAPLRSMSFVENRGQMDRRIRYLLAGDAASVEFADGGPTLVLRGAAASASSWVVRQVFVGGDVHAVPKGESHAATTASYFRGPQDAWVEGAPTFRHIVYRNVWPGIDAVYSAAAGNLEYSFVVHAGADPAAIAIAYLGASTFGPDAAGDLRVRSPVGGFADRRPVAFQVVEGRRTRVGAAFARRPATAGPGVFGFRVGPHRPDADLVVDPVSIGYAGYIGGTSKDIGLAVAVGPAGDAYVVGQTLSTEATFPTKVGPDLTANGQTDAFVCKVDTAGQMRYCGFIGGAAPDRARAVAVDDEGDAYVYGWTRSRNKDGFPLLVGPDLTYNGGTTDTFLCEVNPQGTGLIYSGYIGGDRHDEGKGLALGANGAAYVTGGTKSPDFPVVGGLGQTYRGNGDVFVAKVAPDGSGLVWSGYIGGAANEHARGIGVDANGNVYVAGTTHSSQASFPVEVGPDLTYNGGGDGFVAKVAADGSALEYLGYVGGAGFDDARDATVDPHGDLFLCGHTDSTQATFPVTVGPDRTYNGGKEDAFVAMVGPAGTSLAYAGYVGGTATDACYGIGLDGQGNAYLTGHTFSTQSSFPVRGGPDLGYNGDGDAFVAEVAYGGASLVYCGYIGGMAEDVGWALAATAGGRAIVTGQTQSGPTSFPVKGGPVLHYSGGGDAFVASVNQ